MSILFYFFYKTVLIFESLRKKETVRKISARWFTPSWQNVHTCVPSIAPRVSSDLSHSMSWLASSPVACVNWSGGAIPRTWAVEVNVWTPFNGTTAVKGSLFDLGRGRAKDLQDFHCGDIGGWGKVKSSTAGGTCTTVWEVLSESSKNAFNILLNYNGQKRRINLWLITTALVLISRNQQSFTL